MTTSFGRGGLTSGETYTKRSLLINGDILFPTFNTPNLKTPLSSTTSATQRIFPHIPTHSLRQTLKQTSIISRHLATRGKAKYCAPFHYTLAALKRNVPASLVAPVPNSEQINHPFSNHTYTKSTPNHIHYLYAPFVTPTHTPYT